MSKNVFVHFDDEVNKEYSQLIKTVNEQLKKGIKKSFEMQLLKKIDFTVDRLKSNPLSGTRITRKTAGDKPFNHYDVNNLYKLDLVGYWRLIYTVDANEVEIIALLLDYIDHPTYNKIFGYKKK